MWDDFTSCCIWSCLWTDVSSENWGNYIITACVTDVSTHYHVRIHKGCCHTLMVWVCTSEGIHLASLLHHMPRICSLWGVCGGQAGNIFPHCVPSFPSGTICCLSSLCSNQLTAYAEWPAAWGCVCVRVCMEAGDGMWWTSEHVFFVNLATSGPVGVLNVRCSQSLKEKSVWCFHLIAETCRKEYSKGKCTFFLIVPLLLFICWTYQVYNRPLWEEGRVVPLSTGWVVQNNVCRLLCASSNHDYLLDPALQVREDSSLHQLSAYFWHCDICGGVIYFNFFHAGREVFLVAEEMLLAPKIYSPIPHYLLHVINNDSGEELDMLFNKAAPHIYQPNEVNAKTTPQL